VFVPFEEITWRGELCLGSVHRNPAKSSMTREGGMRVLAGTRYLADTRRRHEPLSMRAAVVKRDALRRLACLVRDAFARGLPVPGVPTSDGLRSTKVRSCRAR
jgi:hypothetical protein